MVKFQENLVCTLCCKGFPIASQLRAHQKKAHGFRKFQCNFCQRRFAERSTLTNHLRTHTKETPFGCETCGKKFSHRATLLNHRKTHNLVKAHHCEYCGKGFHRKSNMKRHVMVVHEKNGDTKRPTGRRRTYMNMMNRQYGAPTGMLPGTSPDMNPFLTNQLLFDVKMQHGMVLPPPPLPPREDKQADRFHNLLTLSRHSGFANNTILNAIKSQMSGVSGFSFPPPLPLSAPGNVVKQENISYDPLNLVPPSIPTASFKFNPVKEEPIDDHFFAPISKAPRSENGFRHGYYSDTSSDNSRSPSASPILKAQDTMMKFESPTVTPSHKISARKGKPLKRLMKDSTFGFADLEKNGPFVVPADITEIKPTGWFPTNTSDGGFDVLKLPGISAPIPEYPIPGMNSPLVTVSAQSEVTLSMKPSPTST